MKKHLEYLRSGTALVTLFTEAAITRARGARRIEVDPATRAAMKIDTSSEIVASMYPTTFPA